MSMDAWSRLRAARTDYATRRNAHSGNNPKDFANGPDKLEAMKAIRVRIENGRITGWPSRW